MSVRSFASQLITSRRVRSAVRRWHFAKRTLSRKPRELLVFLEPGEAYSSLLADIVPALASHYGVSWQALKVGPPDKSAAPEPELLAGFADRDADALRAIYEISKTDAPIVAEGDPLANAERRQSLGHYASGMIWFEGEWFWGIDRIHHLERRLGAKENELIYPPIAEPDANKGGAFEMFFSLRSPYSYLAMMRAPDLAERWGATLTLRPILPMVMRALPVPQEKRLYIVRDCKREADRLGIPFGKIEDPIGAGVERGLAILNHAIPDGRGVKFAQSFYRGVWSEGLNAATDSGLRKMVERAGLDWSYAQDAIDDESWRNAVEANRQELFGRGLWGVPSFSVGERSTFGQDRLWQVGQWLVES